ncbi:MAG: hypothetical protein ABH825_00650 [Candidatus Omnitrophota bacterium]
MPKKGQWYMGLESNVVLERDMRKGLEDAKSAQYFYNASFGLYDWLSFDGKAGLGDLEFGTADMGTLDYDPGFAGGYGLRFKLYDDQKDSIKAILGFHHISDHPPSERINDVSYAAVYDEWQMSFLVSKRIRAFQPYLGAKASQLFVIRRDSLQSDWSWNGSDDHFGVVAGSSINLNSRWFINLEGRLIDENAFSVAISYKD